MTSNAHHTFFYEAEAGIKFRTRVEAMIQQNHERAETDPEHARDYAQRAKGMREILDIIKSMSYMSNSKHVPESEVPTKKVDVVS